MRLEARAKSGFYPLPTAWVEPIASAITSHSKATLFDPCCGKGEAVAALGKALGLPSKNVYASEMDERRYSIAKQVVPNCFGPLDFLGSHVFGEASIVYCNPPFDDELGGGGRIEWRFLSRAVDCCKPGGLLIAVLPQAVALDWRTWEVLNTRVYRMNVFTPPGERKYKECILIGHKRRKSEQVASRYANTLKPLADAAQFDYRAIVGDPVSVRKAFYTEQELERITAESSANSILESESRNTKGKMVPPMALTKGHIALLLASGCLDGVVETPGQPPHVVRGSSRKAIEEKTVEEDGKVKVIRTEQIHLTIKTVDVTGAVKLLTNKIDNEVESEEEIEENDIDDSEE